MVPSEQLARLLDPDAERGAEKFAELFLRLTKFFEWRQCSSPEDLAQETIVRGFMRITRGTDIYTDPVHYFFGIARNVLKEDRRAAQRARNVSLDPDRLFGATELEDIDTRIAVEQALAALSEADRALVVRYHLGDRQALCRDLGITRAALRVRAHRIQRRLLQRLRHNPRKDG